MKNYAVTIGIPVYNVEKYIRLTMDSALAQTFNDIEFLVIDDCGTDSSIGVRRNSQWFQIERIAQQWKKYLKK